MKDERREGGRWTREREEDEAARGAEKGSRMGSSSGEGESVEVSAWQAEEAVAILNGAARAGPRESV